MYRINVNFCKIYGPLIHKIDYNYLYGIWWNTREYKLFLEHLSFAHSYLYELVPIINTFLLNYCKIKKYDEDFAYNLEIILIYLENFLVDLDEILENIDNTNLLDMKYIKPEFDTNKKTNLYIVK